MAVCCVAPGKTKSGPIFGGQNAQLHSVGSAIRGLLNPSLGLGEASCAGRRRGCCAREDAAVVSSSVVFVFVFLRLAAGGDDAGWLRVWLD